MGKLEIDQDLIRQLARLLDETGLGEIEVADSDKRLRVARPHVVAAPAPPSSPAPAAEPAPAASVDDPSSHPGAVVSPMVGTAYRAPEPGAGPFVSEGDQVERGQTLLVIEAMKTFNEIRAPRDGRIARILFENGAPVEFGEVLLLIE